jgi:hypothetical protein
MCQGNTAPPTMCGHRVAKGELQKIMRHRRMREKGHRHAKDGDMGTFMAKDPETGAANPQMKRGDAAYAWYVTLVLG